MVETSRYAALFVACLRNELTPAQEAELAEFLDASPYNKALFEAVTDPEKLIAGLRARFVMRERSIEQRIDRGLGAKPAANRLSILRTIAGLAAAVLILVAVALYFWPKVKDRDETETATIKATDEKLLGVNRAVLTLPDGRVIQLDSFSNGPISSGSYPVSKKDSNTIAIEKSVKNMGGMYQLAVPAGANYRAILPDRTAVLLDAMSSIHFPANLADSERKVALTGHAWFEVAGNGKRPFIVTCPHQEIQVLGTDFDVMDYPAESYQRAVLVRGKVKVIHLADTTLLLPGREARIDKGQLIVKRLTTSQVESALSWQKGFFNFDDMDIHSAAFRLAQWYHKEVLFSRDLTANSLGKGNIQRDLPLPVLLKDLETRGLHFDLIGDTIVLKK